MPEMKSMTLNGKTYDCFVDSVARDQVKLSALIGSAAGEQIDVSDASNFNFVGLRVFGKTTQDGTPTPDAPVDLVSVGDKGNVAVSVTGRTNARSMIIATPNGLPGIPVASGGNDVDSDGQQWVCDEKDFARGVYVQRCKIVNLGDCDWLNGWNQSYNIDGTLLVYCVFSDGMLSLGGSGCMVSHFSYAGGILSNSKTAFDTEQGDQRALGIRMPTSIATNGEEFRSWCAKNNVQFIYALQTPIETPLPEEELAAYAALHTYKDHTTVSNDAGAYMELEYVMDAKKYIDSLIISGGSSAGIVDATVE